MAYQRQTSSVITLKVYRDINFMYRPVDLMLNFQITTANLALYQKLLV